MRPELFRLLRTLGMLCSLASVTGCWKSYIRVDVAEPTNAAAPEISTTETYRQRGAGIRTVVIRAPDGCEAGNGCGQSLTELERSLVAGGYRVISWDTIPAGAERSGHPLYERARQLGADAIVLVNDLKTPRLRADEFHELSMRFRLSNPEGDDLGEAPLRPELRDQLGTTVKERVVAPTPAELAAVTAVLDATVVLTDTGEAVWFYRRTQTRALAARTSTSFLFRGRDDGGPSPLPYRLVAPRRPVESIAQPPPTSKEEAAQQAEAGLMRDLTSDFARHLRAGT